MFLSYTTTQMLRRAAFPQLRSFATKKTIMTSPTYLRLNTLPRSFTSLTANVKPLACIQNATFQSTQKRNSSDHSSLWAAERALSLGLLALVPAAIIVPNAVFDNLAAVAMVLHSYWGLEAIVTDYVRPIVVGNVLPKVAHLSLLLITFATLGGLLYFNYNDIGLGRAVRKLWSIGCDEKA